VNWKRQRPSETGWFWFRRSRIQRPVLIQITLSDDVLVVRFPGTVDGVRLDDPYYDDAEWYRGVDMPHEEE
jgi:hypothetical protein